MSKKKRDISSEILSTANMLIIFPRKIKRAIQGLDTLPDGYGTTGIRYRGYDIYLKAYRNYLLFYTVDKDTTTVTVLRILQDGMDWENIIRQWISRRA